MAKTETKIIEIRIDLLKGLTDIAELQKRIDALTASNKANDKSTADLKNQYAANSVALKDYRLQVNSLIKESANEIRTTVQKTGYIEKLKAEVSNLTLQYERLNKTELEGAEGTQVLTSLKGKREELAKLNAAYGNHQLNVGNYSSATKMLGINIGQVMKEMPNFAISARIGIMSLTNNLPMLAETLQQVKLEQIAARKAQEGLTAAQLAALPAGGKLPSMFSLISKSVFGLTGIMSIAMVLMQIFGADIIKWISSVFKATTNTDNWKNAVERLNREFENSKLIMNEVLEIQKLYLTERSKQIAIEIKMNQDRWNELEGRELTGLRRHRESGIKFNKERLEELEKMEIEHNKNLDKLKSEYRVAVASEEKKSADEIKKLVQTRQQVLEKEYQDNLNKLKEGVAKKYITEEQAFEARKRLKEKFDKDIAGLTKKVKEETIKESLKEFDFTDKIRQAEARENQKGLARDLKVLQASYEKKRKEAVDYIVYLEDEAKKGNKKAIAELAIAKEEEGKLQVALLEQYSAEKADIEQKYADKANDINKKSLDKQAKDLADAIEKGKNLLEDSLKYDEFLGEKSAEADLKKWNAEKQNRINFYSDMLEITQGNIFAEAEIRTKMVNEQAAQDLAVTHLTEEQKTAITKRAAKARQNIEQEKWMAVASMAQQVASGLATLLGEETRAGKFAAAASVGIDSAQHAFKTGALSAQYFASGNIPMGVLAAAQTAIIVANGVKAIQKIYAIDDNVESKIDTKVTKTTVTEKFHSGGTIGETTGVEKPITALTGESVNTIATTQMFSPLLSALNQLGGGKAITSGVANTGLGTDMLASAFSKALRNMPAPILIMEEFEKASEKHKKIQNNRIIK